MSVILFTVAIPTYCASDPLPRRGLKKALLAVALCNVAYLLGVMYVYPRICW